ncbi:MAG: AbrB/MazE/SpoVT family DNA-binding domain-containing protein [Candidatus Babeliales bacterium]|nr:AbrB/MazE/SpoVT family DNA-binding domain-containing protein [Candidatus Babeliales bacterium]
MNKKLTKHGNSLALVIDKPILQLLKIDEHTTLEISIEGNALIIRTAKKKKVKSSSKDINSIGDEIMDTYESVFKKLAK